MNKIVLFSIAMTAIFSLWRFGIARTCAYVYLPALIIFYTVPPMSLPGFPNLNAWTAVGYPILAAILFRYDEVAKLRFNLLDAFVLLMMVPPALTAVTNDSLWDAISKTGDLFFVWVLPYFVGRMMLLDPKARRAAAVTLCVVLVGIGMLALVEARLRPYFYARSMQQIGLSDSPTVMVFNRFGFMRAQTTFGHSIDLGVCGVLLGAMIILFVSITNRWKSPLSIAGIGAAGIMVMSSISFTAFGAMAAAFLLFVAFTRPNLGRVLPLPAILAITLLIIGHMNYVLEKDVPRDGDNIEGLNRSSWIRERILQDAWVEIPEAGLLGSGRKTDTANIGVGSVDNSYVLFILQNGWLHLTMWIILALILGIVGVSLLRKCRTSSERVPVAAAFAGLFATFLAMYTVFYGFVYAMAVCILLGIIGSMIQLFAGRSAVSPANEARVLPGRGFETLPQGVPLAHGRRQ